MSTTSSPAHYTSEYPPYDPFFTADISTKMRVPDKIQVSGSPRKELPPENPYINAGVGMNVPDRILVAGSNQHVSGHAPPRELQLESSIMKTSPAHVGLRTPPRVLTLDQHSFPSVEENNINDLNEAKSELPNGFISSDRIQIVDSDEFIAVEAANSGGDIVSSTPMNLKDEMVYIRRKIDRFENRVKVLELENQQLQNREMILLSAGFLYAFLKGIMWLHRNW